MSYDAKDILSRLCALQADVQQTQDGALAADCFCGDGGFWSNAPENYGPTYAQGYRNDGKALEFIEQATRVALGKPSPTRWNTNIDELYAQQHGTRVMLTIDSAVETGTVRHYQYPKPGAEVHDWHGDPIPGRYIVAWQPFPTPYGSRE